MRRCVPVLFFSLLSVLSVPAQGTINFSTLEPTAGVDAPVTVWQPFGLGPGPIYSAALYAATDSPWTLIPQSLTVFQEGSVNLLLMRYVMPVVAEVPGVSQGQPATLIMRTWLTSAGSFDAAPLGARGESGPLLIPSLGTASNPANLPSTFTGFIIPAPEPSPIALAFVGAAILLFLHRNY